MNITITRKSRKAEAVDGILSIDGVKLCDIAEHSATALPAGTYRIVRHKCKQYGRFVPLITSLTPNLSPLIPDCTKCKKLEFVSNNSTMPCICHQIKIGNGIYNRADGSIIVGTNIVPGCLMHSKVPFDNLSERIRKLSSRGSEITLTIINQY